MIRMRASALVFVFIAGGLWAQPEGGPFQATGFKVGEATDTSAIVWTRLTLRSERNPADAPMVEIQYVPDTGGGQRREQVVHGVVYPEGVTAADIREAAPGTDGDVRIRYRAGTDDEWTETPWRAVDPIRDFTRQFRLNGLKPDAHYAIEVESRSITGAPGRMLDGTFRTAPRSDDTASFVFTISTGQGNEDQDSPDGYKIYPSMLKLDPSFFIHTGDIVYYDALAKTLALARYHWQRTYSWPTNIDFHRRVTSYFMKDDHDTWKNDCWPTMQSPYMHEFTFRQGQAVFLEQVPMGDSTYRTVRWGKDLQLWMVEGRDFRSPNRMPDGPDKTVWGKEQKEWFFRTVAESDATFRILVSPTPIVGPDRPNKRDNHANRVFKHEGDEIRRFIADQGNMFVICGDRHWQYMSVHPETGVREYSCGPASDPHAGGWKQNDFEEDYHRYLNVIGGFLSVAVERAGDTSSITFRYHDVDGNIGFEDRIERKY